MEEQEPSQEDGTLEPIEGQIPLSSPPSHKKLIIGIVVVFVLVIVGLVGAYYSFIAEPLTLPVPIDYIQPLGLENDVLDTSNWKTYTNTKYDYQIKYPEKDWYFDWLVEPDSPETVDGVLFAKVTTQKNEYIDQSILHMRFLISVNTNTNNLSPIEWYYFIQYNKDFPAGISPIFKMSEKQLLDLKERVKKEKTLPKEIEETAFNGFFALKQTYEQSGSLSFVKDSNMFVFSWNTVDGKEQLAQAESIFNQILSTFKFIEPQTSVDTSTNPLESNPFTGDKSDIKVVISENIYKVGETIAIHIINNSLSPLHYMDAAGCSSFIYEKKVNGAWEPQVVSVNTSRAPCFPIVIESDSEMVILEIINNNPPSGIYRAVFRDEFYSNEFTILSS